MTKARVPARWALVLGAGAAALAACQMQGPLVVPHQQLACADFSFPIYFEQNSDALTVPARQAIALSTSRVRTCKVSSVEVLGLADADGPAHRNLVLSRQRADAVAKALAAAGLPTPRFDIDAIGEAGAKTPDGKVPVRRRTEVVIHASMPA